MRIQYLCIKVEAGGEMCFTSRSYKKQFLIHLQPRGNCLKGFRAKKKFASIEKKRFDWSNNDRFEGQIFSLIEKLYFQMGDIDKWI